jgi:hypothetical protein
MRTSLFERRGEKGGKGNVREERLRHRRLAAVLVDKVSDAGKGEQREATIGEERGRGSGWRSRGS